MVRAFERFGLADLFIGGYAGCHEAPTLNEDSLAMPLGNSDWH
jgi:hypothetical protein